MKKQRRIVKLFWAAITLLGTNLAIAQAPTTSATVVFYTHGSRLTSGIPGTKSGIFCGKLYDGKKVLLNFRQGFFPEKNLIVALAFEPGPHTFSAGYAAMPHGKLSLVLEPNKTYFVRAESESKGVVVVEIEKGRLDQVPCAIARQETQKATLLSNKKLASDRRGSILALPLPVTCP
jgi:hypothetical protein